MSIPIVENLEQAPEKGDAVWQIQSGSGKGLWTPARDRQAWWTLESIGGWNTTGRLGESQIHLSAVSCEEWLKAWPSKSLADPKFARPNFVFAPTAEAAIERFHASEACPWGEVVLRENNREHLSFVSRKYATQLIRFGLISYEINCAASGGIARYLTALIKILEQIMVFHEAERSGSRDSRIHKALEMERAK